jgi:hypothetical protein
MKRIAADMKRWRSTRAIIEANFGGEMFGQLLSPHHADIQHLAAVETIPAGQTMKEKRIIDTIEPVLTDHRLILNVQVLRDDYQVDYEDVEERDRRFYRLTYQLTRMVKIKGAVRHDDRADGTAGAVRHFLDVLIRQTKAKSDEGRALAIDKEVEHMLEVRKAQGLPLYGMDKEPPALGRPSPRRIGQSRRPH